MRDVDGREEHAVPPQAEGVSSPNRARRLCAGLAGAFSRLVKYVVSWQECARSQRIFASCNDRMLRDIGIGRDMAEDDSTSSFWRLR